MYIAVVATEPYSDAHINPAISISLAIARKFPQADVPTYILAQMIGAMLGASTAWLVYRNHFEATDDGDSKKAVSCTAPAIKNTFSILIREIIGTFGLIFTILHFTDTSFNNEQTIIGLGSLGALPVAFFVWPISLSLGGTTRYAITPARDLGPRIANALLPIKNKAASDKSCDCPRCKPYYWRFISSIFNVGVM